DFKAAFENILKLMPDTRNDGVVIGASPLERFWADEVRREVKCLGGRLAFDWYSDLSFDEILYRVSKLPPHTVLFWGLMSVDAAGIIHESDIALRSLRAVANVPIFSYQEPFFGSGSVGGPMHSVAETSEKTVSAAIRILGGE